MTSRISSTSFGVAFWMLLATVVMVPVNASAASISRQLSEGMSGSDVSILQTYLAEDSTVYPEGLVTGYFGALTKAAVMKFQANHGIDQVGRVGPITLESLNMQISGKDYSHITPTSTGGAGAGGSGTGGDINAPIISNIRVSVASSGGTTTTTTTSTTSTSTVFTTLNTLTNNVANISWSTSEPAKGVVYYGTSPLTEYELPHSVNVTGGSVAMLDAALRTAHNVSISSLQPNATYYYDIYVTDAAGNATITNQATFRTTSTSGVVIY